MFVRSFVTSIVLNFVESSQIESVSIHSESTQLPSELINVTVTINGKLNKIINIILATHSMPKKGQ